MRCLAELELPQSPYSGEPPMHVGCELGADHDGATHRHELEALSYFNGEKTGRKTVILFWCDP